MAWIESHQEIGRHPKTKKLARRLGVSIPTAMGHLHLLWHWAMDFAQEGSLDEFEAWEIADAAMWEGDSDEFIDALVFVGFIDDTDDGFSLHDWHDYAGKLIDRRKEDAERKRIARQKADKTGTSDANPKPSAGCPQDVRTPSDVTVPYRTVPNPTEEANASSSRKDAPKRKRKTQLPDGFGISERLERWAADKDFTVEQMESQLERFKNNAEAKQHRYADWDAAFQNWMHNARDWGHLDDKKSNVTQFQNRPSGKRGFSSDELMAMARNGENR